MFQSIPFVILVICIFIHSAFLVKYKETNYCSEDYCEGKGTHTMCKYSNPGPSINCKGYQYAPLTKEDIEIILDVHNKYRNEVAMGNYPPQPNAADMRKLYWDEELASFSQRWADQCIHFDTRDPHDECKDSAKFPVGQNIATAGSSKKINVDVFNRAMDWFNEIKDFDPEWIVSFQKHPNPKIKIGHYSQFVWSETYLIGCGRAIFQEEYKGKTFNFERLVCDYGPSGNFKGEPVYKIGLPCSECPPRTKCSIEFPGLCELEKEDSSFSTMEAVPEFPESTETELSTTSSSTTVTTTETTISTSKEETCTTTTTIPTTTPTTVTSTLSSVKPEESFNYNSQEAEIGPLNKDQTFYSKDSKNEYTHTKHSDKQLGVWIANKCYCLDNRENSVPSLQTDFLPYYVTFLVLYFF